MGFNETRKIHSIDFLSVAIIFIIYTALQKTLPCQWPYEIHQTLSFKDLLMRKKFIDPIETIDRWE